MVNCQVKKYLRWSEYPKLAKLQSTSIIGVDGKSFVSNSDISIAIKLFFNQKALWCFRSTIALHWTGLGKPESNPPPPNKCRNFLLGFTQITGTAWETWMSADFCESAEF